MGRRKTKAPIMEGMVEVTDRNRRSLEKKYGFEIPQDVMFILPPECVSSEDFWDIEESLHVEREKRHHDPAGIEAVD